jgi:hypothetical protein
MAIIYEGQNRYQYIPELVVVQGVPDSVIDEARLCASLASNTDMAFSVGVGIADGQCRPSHSCEG